MGCIYGKKIKLLLKKVKTLEESGGQGGGQNYVTVQATSQTTAATDVLPASGLASDTIYRVSNWDGSANNGAGGFDVTKYSEYTWDDVSNPNKYVFLCVKSQIGEVFDISAYNNNAKYDTLADALGTNGEHVPQSIRRGGMSVKYVQNSDNKYVEYFLTKDEWSASESDWEKMNWEDEIDSLLDTQTSYIKDNYESPAWYQISGSILSKIALSGCYAIKIPVKQGDILNITGSGGNLGRMWYTLASDGVTYLRTAEAQRVGTAEIVIESGEFFVVAQTNNDNYIGVQAQHDSYRLLNIESNVETLQDKQSVIAKNLGCFIEKNNYTNPLWYEGNTIGSPLTSRADEPRTFALKLSVAPGDIYTIKGSGGSVGKMWYQLDSQDNVVSMADALVVGEETITIAEGVQYLIIQTNNEQYIGGSIIFRDSVHNIINTISNGKLKGKRISILGDSISTFGVPNQQNATGTWTYPDNRCRYPQENLFTNVQYCYWKKLIDRYGMILGINESWAGSLVSNTQETDSGDKGPNRCISSQTRINHLGNNGTPDVILVYAGTNDAGWNVAIGTFNTESPKNYTDEQIASLPVATFADAYRAMLIRLMKTYPTSRIIVVLPNFTATYYTINNLDKYIECIKEECDFFGIQFVDARTAGITIFNGSTYLPDGIHPNVAGMELLYKLLCRDVFDELDSLGL